VHYKLDRGVDHVLIDEAQDTSPGNGTSSPTHFRIHLGAGARDGVTRTISRSATRSSRSFVSGRVPARIRHPPQRAGKEVYRCRPEVRPGIVHLSFRSGPAILQSVDYVFREEAIYRSIHSAESGYPIHNFLADAGPSLIDLWELQLPDKRKRTWRAAGAVRRHFGDSPEVSWQSHSGEIRSLSKAGQAGPVGIAARFLRRHACVVRRPATPSTLYPGVKHAISVAARPAQADRTYCIIDLMNLPKRCCAAG